VNSCLYEGFVRHRRSQPRAHDFRYRTLMFYLDLDELAFLDRSVALFSANRANVFAFHDRDHLNGEDTNTKEALLHFLEHEGVARPPDRVSVLTGCRLLGYVFNPISLYYCYDRQGALDVVVAEVNNTFGDRHLYLLRDRANPEVDGPGGATRYSVQKTMHVSPFISMDATYEFHLSPVGERLAVGIVQTERDRHVLDAQLWGTRAPLSTRSLIRACALFPLVTLKTTAAIHWEALRLYLKGVPWHRRPS
jgi:uncharacterized protein